MLTRARRPHLIIKSSVVLRWHKYLTVVAYLRFVRVRIRVVGLFDCFIIATGIVNLTASSILQDDTI